MIEPEIGQSLRLLYLGETSVPARTVLRALNALDTVATIVELTDPELLPQHLADWLPDVVVVDVGMTDSSATRYRAADLMRVLEPYPTLALTAQARAQRGLRAVLHGAQHYLVVDDAPDPMTLHTALACSRQRFDFTRTLSGRSELLAMLVDGLPDGAILCDREGRVLRVNAVARHLLELGADALPAVAWGQSFAAVDAATGQPLSPDERPLARAIRGDRFNDLPVCHQVSDEHELTLSASGHGLYNASGELLGGIVLFRDITAAFERERQLARESVYDALTGIANRSLFTSQLRQALARAERSQRTLGVLCIDLDRFQTVNESLGHDLGDCLLDAVATRLQQLLRQGDLLCRWGGDRFMVGLENLSSPRDAAAAAQKIIRGLGERFECRGNEIYIGASIGIALYPEAGTDDEQLVDAAGRALAQAKRLGGARLHFATSGHTAAGDDPVELELGIRHALLRRELELRYQPRVNLANGRLTGLEALLRWQHPRFGLLPPVRFLSLLESSGLIHSVGEWTINTACAQLAAWQRRYPQPDLTITINLSPQQLEGGRLPQVVAQAVSDHAIDPGCLEFELGDGAESLQRPRVLETVQALRRIGVGVSLDHFGTHDISISALDSTVINTFVLHQSLLQDIADNEANQRIVRATIAMAAGLDIEIAAEGVENQEQLEFLRQHACTSAQGYYISRPMGREKIETLLHTESLGGRLLSQSSAA